MGDQWKAFEREVRDFLDLDMTTRQWASTNGIPQPDGDLLTAGTWLDGWHLEAKRHKRLLVPAWVEETEDNDPYLIIAKRWGVGDIAKSYVITDLGTIRGLLRRAQGEHRPADEEVPAV